MGQELLKFYEQAEKFGKIRGRVKLATITSISSWKAIKLPDTPELIQKFKTALEIIEKEFASKYKSKNQVKNNNPSNDLVSMNFISLNSPEELFLLEKYYFLIKTDDFSHSFSFGTN